ncbi:MAG: hypothetical protein U0840_26500 [Gemmataceae bacterium]
MFTWWMGPTRAHQRLQGRLATLLQPSLALETLENRVLLTVSPLPDPIAFSGTSGTGLDQFISIITQDTGLRRKVSPADIETAARAADEMNRLIVEAIKSTGVANDGTLNTADLRDISVFLHTNHLSEWTTLHGDDEDGSETGFHLVQNDGARSRLFGKNAIDTVADGIYHLGFCIEGDRFLNEDGDANARVQTVALWLSSLLQEQLANGSLVNSEVDAYAKGTTGTGLDQLVTIITTDAGLNQKISTNEITTGARAADAINLLLLSAIKATGVANDGTLNTADLRDVNAYLRANHASEWTALHGDDEDGSETGFHLVQNDGARSRLFARNAIDTVADGIYHVGFCIEKNRFLNEDGNANARIETVAFWLSELLRNELASGVLTNSAMDPFTKGTTGTGLDQLVTIITADEGLNQKISTSEITAGARAADDLNVLIIASIRATGIARDGAISTTDVLQLNAYIQTNYSQQWADYHGDDAESTETGFHLVQNDGANSRLFAENAVNTVADGIYHLGFPVVKGRFLNEDGRANACVEDVAFWLSQLLREDLATGRLS